jgi:hypothetical protein
VALTTISYMTNSPICANAIGAAIAIALMMLTMIM